MNNKLKGNVQASTLPSCNSHDQLGSNLNSNWSTTCDHTVYIYIERKLQTWPFQYTCQTITRKYTASITHNSHLSEPALDGQSLHAVCVCIVFICMLQDILCWIAYLCTSTCMCVHDCVCVHVCTRELKLCIVHACTFMKLRSDYMLHSYVWAHVTVQTSVSIMCVSCLCLFTCVYIFLANIQWIDNTHIHGAVTKAVATYFELRQHLHGLFSTYHACLSTARPWN